MTCLWKTSVDVPDKMHHYHLANNALQPCLCCKSITGLLISILETELIFLIGVIKCSLKAAEKKLTVSACHMLEIHVPNDLDVERAISNTI